MATSGGTAAAKPVSSSTLGQASHLTSASQRYAAGPVKTWLLGKNYRQEWQQPVRVPILNLGTTQGGLRPLRQGGGKQTKSLRLRATNGREYVLRSIEKNTEQVLSAELRNTLAAKVVQDQVSAAHPYAALTIPLLAEAAGVGHTNPELVYVPDDELLGEFRAEFANTLAILEERDPQTPASFTGQALEKNYATDKALELLRTDSKNRVDQRELVRARLFDVLVADFDRHEDQWRWLAYAQPGGGLLLRAVPRDRDQAYFVNQGLLPNLASRNWAVPAVQGFDGTLRNVNTFMFSARYFDRSFLTEATRANWAEVAHDLQARLTDGVLEAAIRQLPDSVYQLSGPTIVAKLKSNRNALPAYAAQYYRFLARQVDITGSEQSEYFLVERLNNAQTRVRMYQLAAASEPAAVPLYDRTFLTEETREIRLYGYGGNDRMEVNGTVNKGITIRMIGGEGHDVLMDHSHVAGPLRHTVVYDAPTGAELQLGPESRNRTSPDSLVNQYNRQAFRYPYAGPILPVAFNPDDGIFLGVGVEFRQPGFRKAPWAATHRLQANVALGTAAYSFRYAGELHNLARNLDLLLRADLQAPNYVRNFFGYGNESTYDKPLGIDYYRVRYNNVVLQALARRRFGQHQFFAGPTYQRVRVKNAPGSFIEQVQDEPGFAAPVFEPRHYGGVKAGYTFDSRNNDWRPTQGTVVRAEFTELRGLNRDANPLSQLTAEAAGYWTPPPLPGLTMAGRVGSTLNFSDYAFFQAATLGGLSNLRGYRRTRFAGENSLYNNLEGRLYLGTLNTLLISTKVGLLAFHDVGRVWTDAESSATWHTGYGGGLWLEPFRRVVLVGTYNVSREDRLPVVRLGFLF
ncbi:BamA/TamA family outer membrane protein [Hymenobacter sediminicola]|uniref:BamA/TamA family outer membrane protein n=1 Tax=Hymenobacter sediminicola TaxID=2761579 RepID=A0A7G7WBI0_9BACT|nr:BamA/TamA family outer membrane protein [Hymenobacter sediminicola]QNH63723.1 BamA/TamA family outer membrane protein [Hymenobacter sediminicola]